MKKITTPKITIIIPVYNVERYLQRCIESILNQTFTNFELILINDGSPDRSGEICDEYAKKDARIRVIHKKNGGVSSARNVGLREMQGDYVLFIDSDDFIHHQMLEIMLNTAEVHKSDLVLCDCSTVKNYEYKDVNSKILTYKTSQLNNIEILKLSYQYENARYISVCNKLIKRNLIENECFLEELSFGEDHILCNILYNKAELISYLEENLYFYFSENSGSLTKSNRTLTTEMIKAYEKEYEYFIHREGVEEVRGYILFRIILKCISQVKIARKHGLPQLEKDVQEIFNQYYTLFINHKKISISSKIICTLHFKVPKVYEWQCKLYEWYVKRLKKYIQRVT